jgi:hypothetical protein
MFPLCLRLSIEGWELDGYMIRIVTMNVAIFELFFSNSVALERLRQAKQIKAPVTASKPEVRLVVTYTNNFTG